MNLTTEIFGDVVVAHAPEELGGDQAENLGQFLTQLDRLNVVLDLDTTESIDSKGLDMLMDVQEKIRRLGGDLKITTTNHVNHKIFEITRLDHELEVFQSVTEAVKSFC